MCYKSCDNVYLYSWNEIFHQTLIKNMISVIVPVYNTEKYLDRCIQSVLAQTYTDFELLLVDDGSTDYSGAICDKYAEKDSRVRVFHKENGGAWFRVWAPNAKAISVVGDFNNWNAYSHKLAKIEDSSIWEVFVEKAKYFSLLFL